MININEESFYEGGPAKSDLIINLFAGLTLLGPPSIVILLLVILYLNHKALTIAANVNGRPRRVKPANKLIIKSLLAGPPS